MVKVAVTLAGLVIAGGFVGFVIARWAYHRLGEFWQDMYEREYEAPHPNFIEVWSATKRMTQDAYKNTQVTEKLFYGGTVESYKNLSGVSEQPHPDSGSDSAVHLDTDGGTESPVPVGGEPSEGGDGVAEDAGTADS